MTIINSGDCSFAARKRYLIFSSSGRIQRDSERYSQSWDFHQAFLCLWTEMLFEIPSIYIAHRSIKSILVDNFIMGIINTPYYFLLCEQNRSNVANCIAVLNNFHIFISWKDMPYIKINKANPFG